MSAHHQHPSPPDQEPPGKGGHSRLLMIACCVPMLVIAAVIALSGAGLGFLLIAVLCTAMMALMMGGMSHGPSDHDDQR